MRILVIPDVHGRIFWKNAVKNSDYDKIVFLGDYMDPYPFENISVEDALVNFEDIIDFAKENADKTTLLLGNHDMPYFSKTYKSFSWYHSRHSRKFHNDIAALFDENRDMFNIACTFDDVLFTHAGITPGWLKTVFTEQYEITSLDDLVFSLNNLLKTDKGLQYLFMISEDRGGRDRYASCIWADASDTMWYQKMMEDPDCTVQPIMKVKQVYGHTLQAFYDEDRNICYGDIIEINNNKMLDNGEAYVLDTDTYTVEQVK